MAPPTKNQPSKPPCQSPLQPVIRSCEEKPEFDCELLEEKHWTDHISFSCHERLLRRATASSVASSYQGLLTQEHAHRNAKTRGHCEDRMAPRPEIGEVRSTDARSRSVEHIGPRLSAARQSTCPEGCQKRIGSRVWGLFYLVWHALRLRSLGF